jgi:hypothetical protein
MCSKWPRKTCSLLPAYSYYYYLVVLFVFRQHLLCVKDASPAPGATLTGGGHAGRGVDVLARGGHVLHAEIGKSVSYGGLLYIHVRVGERFCVRLRGRLHVSESAYESPYDSVYDLLEIRNGI